MLESLEALVRAESPSDDLAACRRVVEVAADIAARELSTPARVEEIEGRPVFWWGSKNPRIVILAHLDTVWPVGGYLIHYHLPDSQRAAHPTFLLLRLGFG